MSMNLSINIYSFVLGILGLIATVIGSYIAIVSYINPINRFKKYLKKSKNWEICVFVECNLKIYRNKRFPGYQIIIDWNKPLSNNFQEEWIRNYPDRNNNSSYFIRLEANGVYLMGELFVTLDGARTFVPVPRRSTYNDEIKYWYDEIQVQLANIVGEFHLDENVIDFAKNQKKEIILDC